MGLRRERKTERLRDEGRKSKTCDKSGWRQCGSNTFPIGRVSSCMSPFGVYDQHGNVAEHMNLPLKPEEQLASRGGTGETEMKGSWFVFGALKTPPHEDDCRWRATDWHVSRLMTVKSHANYHLGFRCCKSVGDSPTVVPPASSAAPASPIRHPRRTPGPSNISAPMDFSISPEVESAVRKVREFVTRELYPLESALAERRGFRALLPELEKLRDKVRALGLFAPHLPATWGGAGLSLTTHARISEELGKSPFGHYVFNCQAPDAGNMEILHAVRHRRAEGALAPIRSQKGAFGVASR